MATEILRIREMLKNSWDGRMWYGANLKQVLTDIDYEKAFRKPAAGSHNIYELVMHMYCWRKFVLEHLKGNSAYNVEINSELDWPVKYEQTAENWATALNLLESSQNELVEDLVGLKDESLDELVPGKKFSWYTLSHGLIHHDIYHSAQISILKK